MMNFKKIQKCYNRRQNKTKQKMPSCYGLQKIRGNLLKKRKGLLPSKLPLVAGVVCDLGSVLLAGWSLSSGPDRIIASNYMVDYQLLVSMGEHVCMCAFAAH